MTVDRLQAVRIVLVEPAGELNVGSVARVMKNMGLSQLVLVKPQCNPWSDDARQMAVHGGDILAAAQQVETLPEALQGCQRAIATTARPRDLSTPLELPEAALPWLLAPDTAVKPQSALIFGPEDRGLSNAELSYAQRFMMIPAHPVYPSLNLAQAVAVCCTYLYRFANDPDRPKEAETDGSHQPLAASPVAELSPSAMASLDNLEGYFQHLEEVLLKIGYLYPHTAKSRMEKFRRLLHRAAPTEQEVALLRGTLRQLEWALAKASLPDVPTQ
ncbi:RNA methyltransferase [Almyronema epifaneia]|uniref:tRNA (cytidine/uridine-2'-O-)-methyltransferase TrmJ n=1 Tax=Almyronema epifaneia S1 TaxID=2991925 RepID=A0ABW6IAT3_9CYAN